MTQAIKRHWPAAVALAILAVATLAVLPLLAERAAAPRQIVLVARGMSFVIEGQTQVNPTLRLTAGERVEIVLRNDTAGIAHDFAIPAWKVGVDAIRKGESATVTFDAPKTPGASEYECRPHAQMMRGRVEVVAP